MTLPINEIFETFQGEATWTGTPSVFVRLQGCDVGCPWCDTKHTWAVEPGKKTPATIMLSKEQDADTYARMAVPALVNVICGFASRHVVITGGEPCMYDLRELSTLLRQAGRRVQVETSGTEPLLVSADAWVTVSPKIEMPGGKVVRRDALMRSDEIKHPVGKLADVAKLQALLREHGIDGVGKVWLQPLSTNEKATALCVEQARANDWRVSLQTHKFLGVR